LDHLDENLKRKLTRFKRWTERWENFLKTHTHDLKGLYEETQGVFDRELERSERDFEQQELDLKTQLEQSGKNYATEKYKIERDTASVNPDIDRARSLFEKEKEVYERRIKKIGDDRLSTRMSLEKQKNALADLYDEQLKHISRKREKFNKEWKQLEEKVINAKSRFEKNISEIKTSNQQKIDLLRGQLQSKQEGWDTAIEVIRKNLKVLQAEKENVETRLQTIRSEKEQELEVAKVKLATEKEKLEIDKRAIIEKAEEDQRKCEADVRELKEKVSQAEKEYEDLVLSQDTKKKDEDEGYQREEAVLKESLKVETEKRDSEQKMYEQEKLMKEKELNGLREEYERKKWHWENQMRTLMMKRSVQEAENDADRLRVDREARASFRTLEAKRDELKQRLADIKARHNNTQNNFKKESDLIAQRWSWRKDRLWRMWQDRIEIVRKERESVHQQLEALIHTFNLERKRKVEDEKRQDDRVNDLQQHILQLSSQTEGDRRGREIQNELEKTRLIAQIKECEATIQDWMDRTKLSEAEFSKGRERFGDQLNFIDRLYREEQRETEAFLSDLTRVMESLKTKMVPVSGQDAA